MAILIGLWHRLNLWLYLSPFLLRGVARPDHRLGSISQCRRDLCQSLCWGLMGHLCLRGLTWRVGMRLMQVAKSLLVAVSPPVLLSQEEKGGVGVSTPDVPEPSTTSSSSSSTSTTFQVGMLFKFFDQWRSITSNRFVHNMVRGHHLQLRSHPPLFRDFWHFNVKAAAAHHPVIQKEVDELLAKGGIEPSWGGAGFYSSVFVVPKHTGGLRPILNLKCFNHFIHIPSFKMPTLKNVWQLIQQGVYAFSIDLQDAYLHVPIVKHYRHFLHFVWYNVPYQWKVLPFGLVTAPRVFTSLTKPILFLCHHKGLHIVIYLDDILVLVHSKRAGKRACLFLCSCWSILVYTSILPSQTFASLSLLLLGGCVGILSTCWYLYLLIS